MTSSQLLVRNSYASVVRPSLKNLRLRRLCSPLRFDCVRWKICAIFSGNLQEIEENMFLFISKRTFHRNAFVKNAAFALSSLQRFLRDKINVKRVGYESVKYIIER